MPHYSVALDSVAHYVREASVPFSDAATATEACAVACDAARGHDRPMATGVDGETWDTSAEVFRADPVHVATRASENHVVRVSLKSWACRNERVEADGPDAAVDGALDTDDTPGWPTAVDGWALVHVEPLEACDPEGMDGPDPDGPEAGGDDGTDETDTEEDDEAFAPAP